MIEGQNGVTWEEWVALARACEDLHHDLRLFWKVLLEENGNQIKAARRLGIHRNTARARIRTIRRVLAAHGFTYDDTAENDRHW